MAHADGLSRVPLPDTNSFTPIPEEIVHLVQQLSTLIVTADKIRQGSAFGKSSPIHIKWMDPFRPKLTPYHSRQNEMSTVDGCILWGARVVIPAEGRQTVLSQLHECHPGISRMKSLARCYVWWPNMDRDIETVVRQCQECQIHHSMPPKAPLHPWEYPQNPWSRIHIDHAGPFLGHIFLIVVDAYSKWIETVIQ